jgi:nitrite reductase (NADH) small subunit
MSLTTVRGGVPAGCGGTGAPQRWVAICQLDDLEPERGVAAIVDGVQVAVFRLHDGRLAALDHRDPFSGANVLARGLVGTRGDVSTVASPMYKQVFDLRSGVCLDDPTVSVRVHAVRVDDDGTVLVKVSQDVSSEGMSP